MKKIVVAAGLIAIALLAAGCHTNAQPKSDETACVYDGDNSQKLKFQVMPGENKQPVDHDDEVVYIPTSFRFYAAFENRAIADAGAPKFYVGYARGNTPIQVQGSFKFRFLTESACEWYARHGRRNADENGSLGFNARSSEAASDFSPWVRWLNENFGPVGGQTVKSASTTFTWPELVYGNDPAAPERGEPVDIVYGKYIGREFTRRLNDSLGGRFFCGTDPSIWTGEIDNSCPPIFFEVGPIHTQVKALETEREKTEALRAELDNATVQAKIRAQKAGEQLKDNELQQKTLRSEMETARLQAQVDTRKAQQQALKDPEVAKCMVYASRGLDCDGKHPQRIIVGAGTGG
jgi:hypothetical protein